MTEFGSFVFFDLETTGLPGIKTPKITEIALIACSKKHLLETEHGQVPRVLHKQTFCVNPQRNIHPKASETTGLYNDLLEHEDTFNENTAQLIVSFLERLQNPICLVAHNGNRFDFIILKYELEAHGIGLPDYVYCVDSLQLFRHLDKEKEQKEKSDAQNEQSKLTDLELETLSAMEELERGQVKLSEMQKLNETTPQRRKMNQYEKRVFREHLGVTPPQVSQESVSRERRSPPRSKRQLFLNEEDSPKSSVASTLTQRSRKKFRLCDVYERYYGRPPKVAHFAESDVKALLKCAIADAGLFVEYAEKHCVKMSNFSSKF